MPLHPPAEDGGVHPGALERKHLVAVLDATRRHDDLAGRHLLEQREGVLEVGDLPAVAQILDQEGVRVEQLEDALDLFLVGDLDDDIQAELGGHHLHLGELVVVILEGLGDQDDAVGAAEAALVELIGVDQDAPVQHREGCLLEARRHGVAHHGQAGHPSRTGLGQEPRVGLGDAQHEGDLLAHDRLGERADRIERLDGLLELGERTRTATLLQRPAAGGDHAVKRGHRPPVR